MNQKTSLQGPPRDPAGRPPPHNLDAEAAVISACMNKREAVDEVSSVLLPEHFYSDPNRTIYQAILALSYQGRPIDLVTVNGYLRDRGEDASAGGPSYLGQLSDATPDVHNVMAHAKIVLDKARVRQMIAESQRIAAEGYGDIGPTDDWIDGCETAIHAIAHDGELDASETALATVKRVYEGIMKGGNAARGLTTGLHDLDWLLGGLRAGQLIVIGALPGCGKSALAQTIAHHVAQRAAHEVLFVSLEMSREELAERALFADARVDASKLTKPRNLTEDEKVRLTDAAPRVGLASMTIDDRKALTPLQIRAKARRVAAAAAKHSRKLALVVVDYLQLVKLGGKRPENREQEVAEISRSLKALAGELKVPVLALAQLNTDSMNRQDRRPRAADLRESRAIWSDSDKVILIHAPEALERAQALNNGDEPFAAEQVELIIGKNRGGRMGICEALFWPSYVCFTDRAAAESADAPRTETASRRAAKGRAS